MLKLKFVKDTKGIYGTTYKAGDVIEYRPWNFEWQGMTEAERVDQGIYVHCFGHGEFEIYREGQDVAQG